MRLMTIRVPEGQGTAVAELAFKHDITHVSFYQAEVHRPQQSPIRQDVVEIETATPLAKHFIEALLVAPFFEPGQFTFAVEESRSLVAHESPARITRPLTMPTVDVFQELWQFVHVTWSQVGRVLVAALLLAYGMIEMNTLVMIAGLLFLPYHHHMIAIALGIKTRQWHFAGRALLALAVTTVLIIIAGAVVALLTKPPMKFDQFGTLTTAFAIGLIIGIAAALASGDDAGRRELIGLAATAHITPLPAWFGISLIFGFPEAHISAERITAFAISVSTLILAALIVYALMGMRGDSLAPLAKLRSSKQ